MSISWTGLPVLPVRERAETVNKLLRDRFDRLLHQVMRETGIDCWLIVCHEDNHDPVFRTMIPWQSWTPILQILYSDKSNAKFLLNYLTEISLINILEK